MVTGGREEGDRLGVWDWHVHTAIFKTDNQQGPTVKKKQKNYEGCNVHDKYN